MTHGHAASPLSALSSTFMAAAGQGQAPVLLDPAELNVATVTIFEQPPATLSPPALVMSRPVEVRYSTAAYGIDDAEFPVICVGPIDDDTVDDLVTFVRTTLLVDPTLSGRVQSATAGMERSWRMIRVAGTDLLAVDVVLNIRM